MVALRPAEYDDLLIARDEYKEDHKKETGGLYLPLTYIVRALIDLKNKYRR